MDALARQQLHDAWTLLEAGLSHSEIHDGLRTAIRAANPECYVWLQDVYDTEAIASLEVKPQKRDDGVEVEQTVGERYFRFPYVVTAEGQVALGAGIEVRKVVTYEPVQTEASESAEIVDEFVPLIEKAVRRDGTIGVKIIQPGLGSSGFYPAEVLERDGPRVFTKGTKMYADHATPTEEAERPEGSIKNLVAELVSDARWDPVGEAGPGLYADAKVFEHWQPFIEELAPHIGVSIRASGRAKPGEIEGRRVPVIEQLVSARSVDFVTTPGAGGQITTLFEAARSRAMETITPGGEDDVNELQEAQAAREAAETKLTEARTELAQARDENPRLKEENARLREGEILGEARAFVAELLPADLPEITRARLLESLAARPVVKDGSLDREAFKAGVEAAAKAEGKYLAQISGRGKIRGMGADVTTVEESAKSLEMSFQISGSPKARPRLPRPAGRNPDARVRPKARKGLSCLSQQPKVEVTLWQPTRSTTRALSPSSALTRPPL
jgi:hypothetical protein